jgi:hypothetical protein
MGRDSNPRYGFPYSGFQDRRLRPLGHPSGIRETLVLSLFCDGCEPMPPARRAVQVYHPPRGPQTEVASRLFGSPDSLKGSGRSRIVSAKARGKPTAFEHFWSNRENARPRWPAVCANRVSTCGKSFPPGARAFCCAACRSPTPDFPSIRRSRSCAARDIASEAAPKNPDPLGHASDFFRARRSRLVDFAPAPASNVDKAAALWQ